MTSLQFYPKIKNDCGGNYLWGISRIPYVGCDASIIREEKVRYGLHNSCRELVTGQTTDGIHSEALA